jgi:YrbI family 3-deoxy-D-manno-octulosonate 8-phosphate phosphatase
MKPIAIIPARGGSKGLPRKNVLPLCGRQLIAWNVLAALEACGEGHVYVTTDDAEIAAVGAHYGARIIHRPAELAADKASSESALLHALDEIRTLEGGLPDHFLFLQCTSPLTTAEDIRSVAQTLQSGEADSVFSATPSHRFLWKSNTDGAAEGINHDSRVRLRRQDMEPEFAENGAIYGMRTEGFLQHQHRFFGRTRIHVMPEERSWEIDSPTDFKIAEKLLRERLHSQRASLLPSPPAAVVFDFDGVMTNNRVLTDQDGGELVACDRSDGLGLAALRATGIPILVLSTEENPVVLARCAKLKLPCLHGQADKAKALGQWLDENQLNPAKTIYLGNDRNDSGCMELVGCPVAVADAYPEALQRALIVLEGKGGEGAVRELCDFLLGLRA